MINAWFPTYVYSEPLMGAGLERFNAGLAAECRSLRQFDRAGRNWSKKNYPGGYTSYASLNELHRFSSTFTRLEQRIARHVRLFSRALDMDLRGREIRMTDCWVNIMPPNSAHSMHLHPLSFLSGTYYVATPAGCPGIKFEDPRLDRFMAAPPRVARPRKANLTHVTYPARAGNLILFESWLRHGVAQNTADGERISISFNYNWS
jgi:uncharacterized protein (TIGR02466 family)